MRTTLGLLWALTVTLLAGCSSTTQRVYDISVRNETDRPVTLWLTKDGPPAQREWRSPEQLAIQAPGHEERIGGTVVPPGKTAYTGPIEGLFRPGAHAWLRIYDGQFKSFSDLLAVSPNSGRVDHVLDPGKNELIVKQGPRGLMVEIEKTRP